MYNQVNITVNPLNVHHEILLTIWKQKYVCLTFWINIYDFFCIAYEFLWKWHFESHSYKRFHFELLPELHISKCRDITQTWMARMRIHSHIRSHIYISFHKNVQIRFHTSALLTQTLFRVGWEGGVVTCLSVLYITSLLVVIKARVRESVPLILGCQFLFPEPFERKNDLWDNSVLILRFRSTLSIQTLSCHQWSCPPPCPTSNPRLLAHCWPSSRTKAAGKAQLCLITIHVQSVLLKQSPSPHEEQHLHPSPSALAGSRGSSRGSQWWQYVLAGEY